MKVAEKNESIDFLSNILTFVYYHRKYYRPIIACATLIRGRGAMLVIKVK